MQAWQPGQETLPLYLQSVLAECGPQAATHLDDGDCAAGQVGVGEPCGCKDAGREEDHGIDATQLLHNHQAYAHLQTRGGQQKASPTASHSLLAVFLILLDCGCDCERRCEARQGGALKLRPSL